MCLMLYWYVLLQQVFVVEKKLFTLSFIDEGIMKLNIRSFDGDRPSSLSAVSLTTTDSNLHQHGNLVCVYACSMHIPYRCTRYMNVCLGYVHSIYNECT